MITKITEKNQALYKTLFEKAEAELGFDENEDLSMSSLDLYFSKIKNLVNGDPQRATAYLRLPLDEPFFKINADTREIEVPSALKTISVQGDELAETVYFSVDRYFDSIDLFDEKTKILVEWETAPNSGKVTTKGLTKTEFKDDMALKAEGKIVFAWPLSSKITSNPGMIKFAVRFYRLNDKNELDFSLSTLTATATIAPALNFSYKGDSKWEFDVEDHQKAIMNRISNSAPPKDAGVAKLPNIILARYKGGSFMGEDDQVFSVDLVEGTLEGGINTLYQEFTIQAVSPDAGKIQYEWKLTKTPGSDPITVQSEVLFIKTEDETYNPIKTYFYKSGKDAYSPIDSIASFTEETTIAEMLENIPRDAADKTQLFEEKNMLIIQKDVKDKTPLTGTYQVTATNIVGYANNDLKSSKIIIPGPEKLTLNKIESEDCSVETDIDEKGNIVESVHVYLNSEDPEEAAGAIIMATASTEQDGDTIIYKWSDQKHSIPEEDQLQTVRIGDETISSVCTVETVQPGERQIYDNTYSVLIKAARNGDESEPIEKKIRVTDRAHAPIVEKKTPETEQTFGGIAKATMTIGVSMKNHAISDNIHYEWHKVIFNAEQTEAIESGENLLDIISSDDLEDNIIPIVDGKKAEGTTKLNPETETVDITLTTKDSGYYYCKVTNEVNGSTASQLDGRNLSYISDIIHI